MASLQRLIKMKKITEVRCSGLSRPMNCAGFLFFENLPEQVTNSAAMEGTACGELLAHYLTKPSLDVPTHATNGIAFDDDMKFHAGEVAEEIRNNANGEILCETRIDWETKSGILIKGSYDISYVGKDNKLYIDDLKYGWNLVEVKDNWQLLGYAIGEVIRRQIAFDRIVLRIHQPRPHHEDGPTREWELTYVQLLEYKEKIEARMGQIAGGFAQLSTGKQCKYCPAAPAACTAFNKAVFQGIDHVVDHFQQDDISEKEVSFQLDLLTRVTEVLKIKTDSLNQLAVDRIKRGGIIPNYMTEERLSDRKWKKEVSPLVIQTLTGIDIIEKSMMSPAKAEKLGVPKDLVKTYVDRHFIGQKLVRKDVNALGEKIFGKNKHE